MLETLHCLFALVHYLQFTLVFLLLDSLAFLLLVLNEVVVNLLTNYLSFLEVFYYLKAHRRNLAQSALRLFTQTATSRSPNPVNLLNYALFEEMVLQRKVPLDQSLENGDTQFKIFTNFLSSLILRNCKASSNVVDDLCCDSLISAQIFH